MTTFFNKTLLLAFCLALSVLVHILSLYTWKLFGTYNFATPVNQSPFFMMNMSEPADRSTFQSQSDKDLRYNPDQIGDIINPEKRPVVTGKKAEPLQAGSGQHNPAPEQKDEVTNNLEKVVTAAERSEVTRVGSLKTSHQPLFSDSIPASLGKTSDFLATKSEKFMYQISMLGVPIGSAELEAKNENGEVWIILRVKSNAAISSVYPVDDIIETRHIDGKFIITKIKQLEGSFKSDEWFTINSAKRRVSSFSNINGRTLMTTIPTGEVLDTLSGLYYLRNRHLQVGHTEVLHVFDSEIYAEVPVEILRKETVRLPNFTLVDTLVIQPLQKSAGIFRRTGDVLIWMTDDSYKVPVKIVTSVALGMITVELVSAESTPLEDREE